MSTQNGSLRQVLTNDGTLGAQLTAPSLPTAPKPPRYTYVLPNKARHAMEAVVGNRRKQHGIMREARAWETQQKEGMALLDRLVSELSDLDHRKAPIVAVVKSLRINLPEIGGLLADMAMLNSEDLGTLTEQLTHGRREVDAPGQAPAPPLGAPAGHNGQNGAEVQP